MPANTSPGTEIFQGERKAYCTGSAPFQIKAAPGRIRRILVQAGTGAIDVYDDADSNDASKLVWSIAATTVGAIYELDCPMTEGIRVVMAAAGRLTVVYD